MPRPGYYHHMGVNIAQQCANDNTVNTDDPNTGNTDDPNTGNT